MKATDLVPLPSTIGSAPDIFLGYLNGKAPDMWEALHAGYHIEGYVLNSLTPHDPSRVAACPDGSCPPRQLSHDELKAHVTALKACDPAKAKAAGPAAGIDLGSLLFTLMPILQQLLQQLLAKK